MIEIFGGGDMPTRPVMRYHGGKWILAKWILAHFPKHRVYVEPFGGAASVLLQKPRSYAEVYNDLDGEIVNLFNVVRSNSSELVRQLLWTPFSRDEFKNAYLKTDDPIERARRIVIRSFQGFGSAAANRDHKTGFRANSNRSGTTPAHDWGNFPPTMRAIARRFRGVVVENRTFAELIPQHDTPDTLFYCDPPYVFDTRSFPKGAAQPFCYRHEMTDAQHVELADILKSVKGMVVLSGYASGLYDDLYRGWHTIERKAFGDGACERVEVLWINDLARSRLGGKGQGVLFGADEPPAPR
jgi:DNA adenine methylase